MKTHSLNGKSFAVGLILCIGVGVSLAEDPSAASVAPVSPGAPAAPVSPTAPVAPAAPPIPRTNVDSTVLGDAVSEPQDPQAHRNEPLGLSNDRGFQAGAPDLIAATEPLHLSVQQKEKIHAAIEQADAGAAILIKRENSVRGMLAASTPAAPAYAELKAEQDSADARWKDNRDGLRKAVSDILTPAQRAKFEH